MLFPLVSFRSLDRRVGLHVPVQVAGTGDFGPDDADRRTFRIGAQNAHDPCPDPDLDTAGYDSLLGLAGTLGVEDFEREAVLLENAGALADIGNRRIPQSALADRNLQCVLPERGRACQRKRSDTGKPKRGRDHGAFPSCGFVVEPCDRRRAFSPQRQGGWRTCGIRAYGSARSSSARDWRSAPG